MRLVKVSSFYKKNGNFNERGQRGRIKSYKYMPYYMETSESESDMYSATINEYYYAEAGVVSKGVNASCNWKDR